MCKTWRAWDMLKMRRNILCGSLTSPWESLSQIGRQEPCLMPGSNKNKFILISKTFTPLSRKWEETPPYLFKVAKQCSDIFYVKEQLKIENNTQISITFWPFFSECLIYDRYSTRVSWINVQFCFNIESLWETGWKMDLRFCQLLAYLYLE